MWGWLDRAGQERWRRVAMPPRLHLRRLAVRERQLEMQAAFPPHLQRPSCQGGRAGQEALCPMRLLLYFHLARWAELQAQPELLVACPLHRLRRTGKDCWCLTES